MPDTVPCSGSARGSALDRTKISSAGIETVRDGRWHHLAATKSGTSARLHVDGTEIHSGGGAASTPAAAPWHVMRSGTNPVHSEGEADEVALYTRSLSAAEVKSHYDLARGPASAPLPPESASPAVEPPAAGTGRGGGVLRPAPAPGIGGVGDRAPRPARGARRGGQGQPPAGAQAGSCLASRRRRRPAPSRRRLPATQPPFGQLPGTRVRRVALYGGDRNDRLAVVGRIPALLAGGHGSDRLSGGPLRRVPRRARRRQDRAPTPLASPERPSGSNPR
jgi:Concanavalin A-like lectin/glucanases superfamily